MKWIAGEATSTFRKPNVRKCEFGWRTALEGESTSVENTREEVWRKTITSNNEEKKRDEPVIGPRHLEEKTFPRSKRTYKIQPFMPKYLETRNI